MGNEDGLILFYDFDDADTALSLVGKNKGYAGSEYNIHLGTVFGTKKSYNIVTDPTRQLELQPPFWAPSTRSYSPQGKPVVLTIVPSETLEFSLPANSSIGASLVVKLSSLPLYGIVTDMEDNLLQPNATILPVNGLFTVKYRINQNYSNSFNNDSFEYTALDEQGNASALVFILLNTVPRATNATLFTIEDRIQYIRLPGVDSDGDQITTWITRAPRKGELYEAEVIAGNLAKVGKKIDLSVLPAMLSYVGGGLYYQPPLDESGLRNFDRFAFKVMDSKGQSSNEAWVTVSVRPVNKLPVAHSKNISTIENEPVIFELSGYDIEGG